MKKWSLLITAVIMGATLLYTACDTSVEPGDTGTVVITANRGNAHILYVEGQAYEDTLWTDTKKVTKSNRPVNVTLQAGNVYLMFREDFTYTFHDTVALKDTVRDSSLISYSQGVLVLPDEEAEVKVTLPKPPTEVSGG